MIQIIAGQMCDVEVKGGQGSGNFGHEGRPGEVGGSGAGGGGMSDRDKLRAVEREEAYVSKPTAETRRIMADFNRRHPIAGGGGDSGKLRSSDPRDIRDAVQDYFNSRGSELRSAGAQTYVSTSDKSPNMGQRHFIDVSHPDKVIERNLAMREQDKLQEIASVIRTANPGARTYVSTETSPNMGLRTYLDVELPGKKV